MILSLQFAIQGPQPITTIALGLDFALSPPRATIFVWNGGWEPRAQRSWNDGWLPAS